MVVHGEVDVLGAVDPVVDTALGEEVLELHVGLYVKAPVFLALKDDVGLLLFDADATVGRHLTRVDAVGACEVGKDDTHRKAVQPEKADVGDHGLVRAVHKRLCSADEAAPCQLLAGSPTAIAKAVLLAKVYALAVAEDNVHHAMFAFVAAVVAVLFGGDEAVQHLLPRVFGLDERRDAALAEGACNGLLLHLVQGNERLCLVAEEGGLGVEVVGCQLHAGEVGGQEVDHALLKDVLPLSQLNGVQQLGQQFYVHTLQGGDERVGQQYGGTHAP